MANEITVTTGVGLNNGLLTVSNSQASKKFDQTTARGGNPGTVDVGTSEETISFGDCVPGFVEMVNLDPTNYVNWGFTTGNLDAKLLANGGPSLIYMDGGTLIMQADTAACSVRITAVNQ